MFAPTVVELDFLPADFHVRRMRRRARNWRLGVAGAFVALTAVGLFGNHFHRTQLRAESERLRPQAEAVAHLEHELDMIRKEAELVGLEADLRSQLRLRAAATRLLAATTRLLPDGTAMNEFHIAIQKVGGSPQDGPKSDRTDEQVPPAQRDLERIALEAVSNRTVVTIRGLARDDETVSTYLSSLRDTGLFDDVRLLVTDRHESHGYELRLFAVELRVRMGRQAEPSSATAARDGGRTGA